MQKFNKIKRRMLFSLLAVIGLAAIMIIRTPEETGAQAYARELAAVAQAVASNPSVTNQMWAQAQGKIQAESYAAQQQNAYWAAYQAQAQAGMKQLLTPASTPRRQEHINYRVNPYTGDIQGTDGTTMSRIPDGSISVTTGGVQTSSSYLQ